MNQVSRGGLALAEHIAEAYADNAKVRAIMVGGSVSRGWADHYSDLEIGIFWAAPPSDDERRLAVGRLGGDLWSYHPYTVDSEWLAGEHYGLSEIVIEGRHFTGQQMIDTKHLTVSATERCLSDVVEQYDTSFDKLNLLSAVQYGLPLRGRAVMKKWQMKAASFPEELAVKLVQENLWFGPWFCPEAYSGRDDALVLHQHFVWIEQGILKVLLALNRIYPPSREFKWLDQVIPDLRLSPDDLASRMKQALQGEPSAGWIQLKSLINETIGLVEVHLPKVNTISMFAAHPEVSTGWARQRWEVYPAYTLMESIGAELA